MKFKEHNLNSSKAIEIISEDVVINSEQDALDLMANIGYLYNSRKIIIHEKNLCMDFFNLSSGIAGGIMQKFSNYRVQAVIIGDFNYNSKSLKAFILECNRTGQVKFSSNLSNALEILK